METKFKALPKGMISMEECAKKYARMLTLTWHRTHRLHIDVAHAETPVCRYFIRAYADGVYHIEYKTFGEDQQTEGPFENFEEAQEWCQQHWKDFLEGLEV